VYPATLRQVAPEGRVMARNRVRPRRDKRRRTRIPGWRAAMKVECMLPVRKTWRARDTSIFGSIFLRGSFVLVVETPTQAEAIFEAELLPCSRKMLRMLRVHTQRIDMKEDRAAGWEHDLDCNAGLVPCGLFHAASLCDRTHRTAPRLLAV